jgi:ABC-type phosphate/phosphonate transport system permease subunit
MVSLAPVASSKARWKRQVGWAVAGTVKEQARARRMPFENLRAHAFENLRAHAFENLRAHAFENLRAHAFENLRAHAFENLRAHAFENLRAHAFEYLRARKYLVGMVRLSCKTNIKREMLLGGRLQAGGLSDPTRDLGWTVHAPVARCTTWAPGILGFPRKPPGCRKLRRPFPYLWPPCP